jgi:hypothetical protein
MEAKKKVCNGINQAKGFKGCGKEVYKRTNGLCDSCLYDFYTTDERGKIIFAKRKIQVTSKREKAFKDDLRQKLKTLSDYEAEAKKVFQKWVRLRDAGKPCKSCQNPNPSDWCGSHFFSAGVYSGMIFDERNCHGCCNTYCNKYLSGNLINYRINLVLEFGEDWVRQLENDALERKNYKYTKDELIEIKKKYEAKIKSLI